MYNTKKIGLILISCLFLLIFVYGVLLSKSIEHDNDSLIINIPKNSDLNKVSNILNEHTNMNQTFFKVAMYMTFNQNNIKYGRYDFKYIRNTRDLINSITSSKSEKIKVTIPEGLRMQDIALLLEENMGIDVENFIYLCYDAELINSLDFNSDITNLEGFLYPDTYIFLKSYNERDIIEILVETFKEKYSLVKSTELLLDEYEAVILASIIQAESKFKTDMDTISSVFHNRLRDNQKLEADPTIQYLLPKRKKRLLYKDIDLYKDSPYNTYTNKGLPPTPINSPGLDAINAALYPPKTKYKFFVADGKGTHVFNYNIKGHNKSKRNAFRKFK